MENKKTENNQSIVIPETLCMKTECPLNCYEHCNSISTLMLSLKIGGLPAPDYGCSLYEEISENKI